MAPRLGVGLVVLLGCQERNPAFLGPVVSVTDGSITVADASSATPDGAGADQAMTGIFPEPTTSGLVAYWKLDEGTGTAVRDSSGNGNDGTLRGPAAIRWMDGRAGRAVDFANDTHVSVPSSPSINGITGGVTMAAWVNTTSTASVSGRLLWNFVIGRQLGTTRFEHYGLAFQDHRLRLVDAVSTMLAVSQPHVDRTWTHVAGTFEGGLGVLYLNGTEVARGTVAGRLAPDDTPVVIGANLDYDGQVTSPFDGIIDEVRLYSRALSAQEIASLAR